MPNNQLTPYLLIRNEYNFRLSLFQNEIHITKIKLTKNQKSIYADLKCWHFLNNLSTQRRGTKKKPIPLDDLMKDISPLYKCISSWGQKLNIKVLPLIISKKNYTRFFEPYKKTVYYPHVFQEIARLSANPQSKKNIHKYPCLLNCSFSYFHELTHRVLFQLCPPPKDLEKIENYFIFLEGLATALDRQLSFELGPILAAQLAEFGLIYKPFLEEQKKNPYHISTNEFTAVSFSYIASLKNISFKNNSKLIKQKLGIKPLKNWSFHKQFINHDSYRWINAVKKIDVYKRHQKQNLKSKFAIQFSDFDYERLLISDNSVSKLEHWLKLTFFRDRNYIFLN